MACSSLNLVPEPVGAGLGNHMRLHPLRSALPTLTPVTRVKSVDQAGHDQWYAGTRGAQFEPSHVLPLRDTPPQSPEGAEAKVETILDCGVDDGYLPQSATPLVHPPGTVQKHFNTTVTTPESAPEVPCPCAPAPTP